MSRGRRLPTHAGAQREFAQEARRLLPKAVAAGPADAVRISIPADHPMAAELLELAKLLATRQQLSSGIQVERAAIPGAEMRLLALLERMGVPTQRIMKDLAAPKPPGGQDALLEAGMGLLRVAGAIAGVKDVARAEDQIRRAFDDSKRG